MKKQILKPLLLTIFEIIIAIQLLFLPWLGVDVYFYRGSAPLTKINNIINGIISLFQDYNLTDNPDSLTAIPVISYLLLGFVLISVCLTLRSIYKRRAVGLSPDSIGFVMPAILAALTLILVWVFNAAIESQTGGWISNVFFIESAPVVTLVFGVIGYVVNNKIPETFFCSIENKIRHSAQAAGKAAADASKVAEVSLRNGKVTKLRRCPSCRAMCSDPDAVFCQECGAELSPTEKCSGCGKELPIGTKFCPYCGTPTTAPTNSEASAAENDSAKDSPLDNGNE